MFDNGVFVNYSVCYRMMSKMIIIYLIKVCLHAGVRSGGEGAQALNFNLNLHSPCTSPNILTAHIRGGKVQAPKTYCFQDDLLLLLLLIVNCGMPTAPGNGSIVAVPSTLGGAEILFRCNTGFVPAGNKTAMCVSDGVSPNGTWIPDPATSVCIGKQFIVPKPCHARL